MANVCNHIRDYNLQNNVKHNFHDKIVFLVYNSEPVY